MTDDMSTAPTRLWTTDELAAYLQVPRQTLYAWRVAGCGPRGLRVGKHVRYLPADVDAWLESRRDAA